MITTKSDDGDRIKMSGHFINKLANQLAMKFAHESEIPKRLKEFQKEGKTKRNPDSEIEKKYCKHVEGWANVIQIILSNTTSDDQAQRFLLLRPYVLKGLKFVAQNQDFIDFTQILVQRRDIDVCSDDELGRLSMLHTAFQREIENQFSI